MIDCNHPKDQRWQYVDMWHCCRCYRYFWGKKEETPQKDIYGRPALEAAAEAEKGRE